MPPTLADRVAHILEAIQEIEQALSNKTYDQFLADRMLRAAIERLVEIVCEATRRIPDEVKRAEPAIHWQKVSDFGNRLHHAYHTVDAAIVWQIVMNDLPAMKALCKGSLQKANVIPGALDDGSRSSFPARAGNLD